MNRALGLFGVRLAAVLALAVSAALFVDYSGATPTFCGVGTGCAAVRSSGFGYVPIAQLYVPVPVFGMIGFALLLGVALTRALRWFLPLVAGLAGFAGLFLLLVQLIQIKHVCSFCAAADVLGMIAGLCGLVVWRSSGDADAEWGLRPGAWPALALVALLGPLAWPRLRPEPPVPVGVRAHYQPGKIIVVEFADYECPYCRALHPILKSVSASYPEKVNFTRLNLPLQSHEFAQGAAQAQVCAREQGKGDEMADRLFSATDLRPEPNRALAQTLGVELTSYDRCISSGKADALIEAEAKVLRDNGLQGLPTTFVGGKTIVGAQQEDVFRDAFDRAERGADDSGVPAPAYWLSVLLLTFAVSWVGRVRRATL